MGNRLRLLRAFARASDAVSGPTPLAARITVILSGSEESLYFDLSLDAKKCWDPSLHSG